MTINHEQYIFKKVQTLVTFFEEPSEDKIWPWFQPYKLYGFMASNSIVWLCFYIGQGILLVRLLNHQATIVAPIDICVKNV